MSGTGDARRTLGPAPDAPHRVRPGEELDVARLAGFLAANVPGLAGVAAYDVEVTQFGGGFSNLTYLVRVASGDVATNLVLRRPPFGVRRAVGSGFAHDVLREYRLLAALRPAHGRAAFARVPRIVAACADDTVLGAPFYLMERVHGVILRGRPGDTPPDAATLRGMSERFVSELASLHAVDWRASGLGEFGRPSGYVARQVSGWTTRWHAARTEHVPAVERVAAWLADHQPPEPCDAFDPAALLHNDFKYDNFVLDPADLTRVVAVLDWEMATVGAPLMDLGTALAYWLEADDPPVLRGLGLGLTAAPGNMTRAELVHAYGRATGRDVSDALFYFVYGVFKLAVVAQQIFARYVAGHTRDPRFARLDVVVHALGGLAQRAVDTGRIDHLG
ncbi:aminoglycoside phosphotransferase [Gemmatimonadetes bacterium T265]|nr:aminoglycoside phosphotransferase [Gemmatimonadetes bacterium T265]